MRRKFSPIAPFIKSINGAIRVIALFSVPLRRLLNSINGAIEVTALFRRFAALRRLCRPFFSSLQIEISHKNQVPMLVGPPPKSRSFFSFLTKDFRAKGEDNFEDDPE